jgi:hypothetical protein
MVGSSPCSSLLPSQHLLLACVILTISSLRFIAHLWITNPNYQIHYLGGLVSICSSLLTRRHPLPTIFTLAVVTLIRMARVRLSNPIDSFSWCGGLVSLFIFYSTLMSTSDLCYPNRHFHVMHISSMTLTHIISLTWASLVSFIAYAPTSTFDLC